MQTILGAGGIIGIELAKALPTYTQSIRLVSRNPRKINLNDELFPADITDKDKVAEAVAGSEVVYLTIGLTYNTRYWQKTWPVIMKNVIEACKLHKTKLVFFDNNYMYDPMYMGNLTEETPVNPTSQKGKVRAQIAAMLQDEMTAGRLEALIARSADFYGPSINSTSVLTETVFKNLAKGKKAQWPVSLNFKHSYTYTPDAGKATALLGNTPDAYNQVWHLPTAHNPMNGKEWVETIAKAMNARPKVMVVSRFLFRLLGLFDPIMKEFLEMLYQYDRDYIFNSEKFEKRFSITPTPYKDGIQKIIEADYS